MQQAQGLVAAEAGSVEVKHEQSTTSSVSDLLAQQKSTAPSSRVETPRSGTATPSRSIAELARAVAPPRSGTATPNRCIAELVTDRGIAIATPPRSGTATPSRSIAELARGIATPPRSGTATPSRSIAELARGVAIATPPRSGTATPSRCVAEFAGGVVGTTPPRSGTVTPSRTELISTTAQLERHQRAMARASITSTQAELAEVQSSTFDGAIARFAKERTTQVLVEEQDDFEKAIRRFSTR